MEYLKLFNETESDKYLIEGFEASTMPLSRAAFEKILELLEYNISSNINNALHSNLVVHVTNTEKEALVKQRIGQSKLKQILLKQYGCCRICGLDDERLLIASHIKPWCAGNATEGLDVNNVFCFV